MATTLPMPVRKCFNPSDVDLINKYLLPKVNGLPIQTECIFDHSLYSLNPHELNWTPFDQVYDFERYYFVKRTPVGRGNNLRNVRRTLNSGQGFWCKSRDDPIYDAQGKKIGVMAYVNFFAPEDGLNPAPGPSKKRKRGCAATHFLMHEYTLPTKDFQEWALCRIKDQVKEKVFKRTKSDQHPHHQQQQPAPTEVHVDALPPPPEHKQVEESDYYIAVNELLPDLYMPNPFEEQQPLSEEITTMASELAKLLGEEDQQVQEQQQDHTQQLYYGDTAWDPQHQQDPSQVYYGGTTWDPQHQQDPSQVYYGGTTWDTQHQQDPSDTTGDYHHQQLVDYQSYDFQQQQQQQLQQQQEAAQVQIPNSFAHIPPEPEGIIYDYSDNTFTGLL